MANLDLSKYGIQDVKEIIHNPSYDVLFAEETKPGLEGFEKGQVTNMGAVNVMTGVYTGRSPKDKFFVKDETSENTVWWTSEEYKNDNKPVDAKCWKAVKELATKELSNKRLFVVVITSGCFILCVQCDCLVFILRGNLTYRFSVDKVPLL